MPTRPIYLDNHATTRVDPRVLDAMLPYFTEEYGNAGSVGHRFGWEAAEALETARERVAALLGAESREIVFTSGATEANNLAIRGALPALKRRGNHLVTTAIEHKSVLDPFKRLGREGWDVTVVPPDPDGVVPVGAIETVLTDRTVLVSVMAANNEIGTLQPLADVGRLCRSREIPCHTDATQAVGKVPLDVREVGVDLLSLSAHKLYGPKGIGALFVRRGGSHVRLTPLIDGGGQERGLRSGTVAVPLAVGLGEACAIAGAEREQESERLESLRERLAARLFAALDGVRINGHPSARLPGNLNVSFAGVDGEALMVSLTAVAVSSGSACTSANPEPSHVLRAIGLDETLARASLRFGIGRFNSVEDVDFAADYVAGVVGRLRAGNREGIGASRSLGIDPAL